jgi:hypothetical protein
MDKFPPPKKRKKDCVKIIAVDCIGRVEFLLHKMY